MIFNDEGNTLMPVVDGSSSKAKLVHGGCVSFENKRSGKICRVEEGQRIAAQTGEFHARKGISTYYRAE